MSISDRVVFDCNVFFQAAISLRGPARRLLRMVTEGHLTLYVSSYVLAEFQELTLDPRIRQKYHLEQSLLDDYMESVYQSATMVHVVPHVYEFPRDPDDAHYVDLAIAVDAKLIVSRDKDLLSLRDPATIEGKDFMSRFPDLEILTPPEVLKLLDDRFSGE